MEQQPSDSNRSDEISLVDLILILKKNIKLFVFVTFIVTLIGTILAFRTAKLYNFSQVLQTARYFQNGKIIALQPANSLKQLIVNVYLPAFQADYNQKNPKHVISLKKIKYKVSADHYSELYLNRELYLNSELYLTAQGTDKLKTFFQQASQYLLTRIITEQTAIKEAFLTGQQKRIKILKIEIPRLERLRNLTEFYRGDIKKDTESKGRNRDTNEAILPALRDIYITDLGSRQNQNNLIQLKMQLADLQQVVSTFQDVKLGKLIVVQDENQISVLVKIILSFFIGLFFGVIATFLKNLWSSIIRTTKNNK